MDAAGAVAWRVKGARPARCERPGTEARLADVLREASGRGEAVVPRGGGTQDTWGGALRRADIHLDLTALAGVVAYEPADLTVTVRAGTRLGELQAVLGERGQWVPLDPPQPERATVGGIAAGGAYGPWRHLHGGPRDLVIGLRVVLPSGEAVRTGGRVVKNVAGFDLGKAFVGSWGTLGVIAEVSLRVRPLPERRRSLGATFASAQRAREVCAAVLQSELIPAAVALQGATLLVAFEEAVDHQAQRFATICAGAAAVADAPDSAWEAVRGFPCDRPLALRLNVPPAAVAATLDGLDGAGFESLAYPGLGTIWAVGGRGAPGAAVAAARRLAADWGGHAVAVCCPEDIDPWGPEEDGGGGGQVLALLRSLKGRFDPTGILSPGRFVGGI